MADAVTSQIIQDGERVAVLNLPMFQMAVVNLL